MKEFWQGLIRENPVFVLALGMCPALAVTTSLSGAFWMGLAVTVVLAASSTLASLLRPFLGPSWRLPVLVATVATLVSVADMSLQAWEPATHRLLGIYVPLIVVNCLILARAESFATKAPVWPAFLDGVGMGLGFLLGVVLTGALRELLGTGQILWSGRAWPLGGLPFRPLAIFLLPPGAFLLLGFLLAAWPRSGREG